MKVDAQKKILLAEIERLAKKVWELKGRNPDAIFYGLPLWVKAIDPSVVGIFAVEQARKIFDLGGSTTPKRRPRKKR
jgi:hypothetical protein